MCALAENCWRLSRPIRDIFQTMERSLRRSRRGYTNIFTDGVKNWWSATLTFMGSTQFQPIKPQIRQCVGLSLSLVMFSKMPYTSRCACGQTSWSLCQFPIPTTWCLFCFLVPAAICVHALPFWDRVQPPECFKQCFCLILSDSKSSCYWNSPPFFERQPPRQGVLVGPNTAEQRTEIRN